MFSSIYYSRPKLLSSVKRITQSYNPLLTQFSLTKSCHSRNPVSEILSNYIASLNDDICKVSNFIKKVNWKDNKLYQLSRKAYDVMRVYFLY